MDPALHTPSFIHTLALALGFAFVIEGLFYTVFASKLPAMLDALSQTPPDSIRKIGFLVACTGLGLMLWIRYSYF